MFLRAVKKAHFFLNDVESSLELPRGVIAGLDTDTIFSSLYPVERPFSLRCSLLDVKVAVI